MEARATLQVRIGLLFAVLTAAAATVVTADRADADEPLEVSFFDVGQADATLLDHPDGTVLIDTGHWQRSDVVDYVQAAGIDSIDLLIVTHPHADHIGQFDQVVDSFDVGKVWWSGATTDSQTFQRAQAALDGSDADYLEPRTGHTRTVGPLEVTVVNPPAGVSTSDIHDSTLAAHVTFGDSRWLFTGDAEAATETRMVSQSAGLLDADVYQVGHHGSDTSTTTTLLDAVDPTVAVWSASEGNQYGHPHASVIERLDSAGVTTYGTADNGTVTATTDGTTITFVPETGNEFTFTTDGSDPDPGDDPFTDIAGTTHEANIRAIGDAGITSGFGDGTFRPAGQVTRGQMATFLTNGLDLPAWQPPATDPDLTCVDINRDDVDTLQEIIHIGPDRAQQIIDMRPWSSVNDLDQVSGIGQVRLDDILAQGLAAVECDNATSDDLPFTDVAGTTHEDSILAVYQANIAGGFGDGTFGPARSVSRGQMATFITNALDLPAGDDATFDDTAGTTHEASIAAVVDAGIAGGYGDGRFGPDDPVRRGQMATFLANALDLN